MNAERDIHTLIEEGKGLRDALRSDDLTEARFRAHQIARMALPLNLPDVRNAAVAVIVSLGAEGDRVVTGYIEAVVALSDAIYLHRQSKPPLVADAPRC
ncbi:hypothetical protein P3W24_05995 [Luteibacter sp. PPL201]|uniref:Uncharacterized protein n=1 Tax=Luteibacter sahnii TaxID=3021977 RepID=A0ABT6B965_9GAMM|nr:hypothetical protein [Luteibacter sp. PPL193]MDY1549425.1 hypothetical protein [Luteibacter sp. PPL193]